jgi:hypothetical protein
MADPRIEIVRQSLAAEAATFRSCNPIYRWQLIRFHALVAERIVAALDERHAWESEDA